MYQAPIFRLCEITGLRVDRTGERLIRANAVAAGLPSSLQLWVHCSWC